MLRRFSSSPSIIRRFLFPPTRKSISSSVNLAVHVDFSAQQSNPLPHASPHSFVKTLSGAADSPLFSNAEQYHSATVKLGFITNLFVATALTGLYCKARNLSSAQQLFDEMPIRNAVTWNTLIHGLSQFGRPNLAASSFSEMLTAGIPSTPSTISTILTSFSRLKDRTAGIKLHCVSLKRGFFSNVVVGTAIINVYCKCSDLPAAHRVFDEMPERNLVTWTSLVTGYSQHQMPCEAMLLVKEMRRLGLDMNELTFSSLLSSFHRSGDLVLGKQAHSAAIKAGLDSDPYTVASLVTMYSKCGSSEDFSNLSPHASDQDQVSYNSIIAGYSRLGEGWEVLEKFVEMRKTGLETDLFTFASVLRAIAILALLREGRQTHALILKSGYASIVAIQNGLVSMYAKCGDIGDSKAAFRSMDRPDLTSWNSLLSGCARHGDGEEAIELFEEMRGIGVKPDEATYLSALSACSHVGLVKKGLEFFRLMKEGDSPVTAGMPHYACVVDLLGRAGFLEEARAFIGSMPIKPGIAVYRALLSACQIHGNAEIAEHAARRLYELCPDDSGTNALLFNVFASHKCWHDATQVRKLMQCNRKEPAWSWC